MSSVSDHVTCEQCGFESAYHDFNCGSNEWDVSCGKCGYYAAAERHEDSDGKVTWAYPERQGFGVLFYHGVNDLPYCHHPLHSKESVEHAEKWLREKLACGEVDADCSYLSVWNPETQAVEFVIGTFYEFPPYDEEEIESNRATSSVDLRPFQLLEKRYQAVLHYKCGHTSESWILLLVGQKQPSPEVVLEAKYLCRACTSVAGDGEGDHREGQPSPEQAPHGNWLWENSALDGTSKSVTPALNHPDTLEESALLFYAAFPERKRMHPQSIGYKLQLESWSDEEIAEKKWLCDCAGCRAYPKSLGCKRTGR